MKLYHYAPLKNTILTDGILSFAMGAGDITPYIQRAKSTRRADVIQWMESCFPGRSRSVSCITEPIIDQGHDPMLCQFIHERALFSLNLDALTADDQIESIWCQDGQGDTCYPVNPDKIDFSPLPWHLCNREKSKFFGIIRHYFIVTKSGFIPPKYLKSEK